MRWNFGPSLRRNFGLLRLGPKLRLSFLDWVKIRLAFLVWVQNSVSLGPTFSLASDWVQKFRLTFSDSVQNSISPYRAESKIPSHLLRLAPKFRLTFSDYERDNSVHFHSYEKTYIVNLRPRPCSEVPRCRIMTPYFFTLVTISAVPYRSGL